MKFDEEEVSIEELREWVVKELKSCAERISIIK